MKVFGWLCDHSGCGHYRIKQPFDELRKLGHDVLYEGSMPADIALGNVDTVIAQRVVLPGPTDWLLKAAHRGTCKIVLEFDDDLFNIEGSNAIAHGFFNKEMQDRAKQVLEVADHVTTTTDHLANRLSEYTKAPITVIPNYVNRWLTEYRPVRRSDMVTVGWAGSSTHIADWAELSSELRRFITRNNSVELHTMGHNLAEKWPKSRHSMWKNSIDEYLKAIDFHIGLAPLRPSIFNRSKSPLKAMEYSALGIPTVASACGPYPDFVQHGVTGYLVDRPHQLPGFLRELVTDPVRRMTMGDAARRHVVENCLIEDNIWRWEQVLKP